MGLILLISSPDAQVAATVQQLAMAGYRIERVEPQHAPLAVLQLQPEFILLWSTANQSDSLELLAQLRALPATQSQPILVLAEQPDQQQRRDAYELGADDYLVASGDQELVLLRVRVLLRGQQQLRQALVTAEHQKHGFLSLVAHELKNPLAAIKGYAELLLRRARRDPQLESQLRGLEMVEHQVNRMARLLDLLLDISRLEMGRFQLQLQPTDLVALLKRAVGTRQAAHPTHTFQLHLVPELRGNFDSARMSQVINNLLSNAIKYSPDGSTISVTLAQEQDQALLIISDEGVGVPAEEQDQIFSRYYRASNVAQVTSGLGLGLYVSRAIVEHHGGTIGVSSSEGQGTTFTVRLPLAGSPAQPAQC